MSPEKLNKRKFLYYKQSDLRSPYAVDGFIGNEYNKMDSDLYLFDCSCEKGMDHLTNYVGPVQI